ncbi:OmpA family protein [Pseudorhodoferax sp. Leaf267]|uniref:OmpA family protein n=1 Tax=Pseudorhodoferax sp. Leaf267 TaxID=1736316 RepID=UPI0006F2BF9F|nr:OmpA family protein [Pseudorhodoferax sp. Leaf267]KQP21694.1 hypothetical protein ASF43_25640 [Pseudorhodoferax sp. Leaf267]
MPHHTHTHQPARRAALGIALAGTAWLLGACAAKPAAPPAPHTRAQALQALGFRPTDAGWEFSLNGKLLFDTDSDQLDAESQTTADRLGRELAFLQIDTIRIEGHTDNTGSAAYNQALSLRRALAVTKALVDAGLRGAKIDVQGLGKAHPVAGNDTPERRLQNRRVSVIVPAQ